MNKIDKKWCDAVNQYANEVIELKMQNRELLAVLKGLVNTPAKDTTGIDKAWEMARQAIAKAGE